MKKALLALALVFLASCARDYMFDEPVKEPKKEKPFWWVLQKKDPGASMLEFEDRWYQYEARFDYVRPGENIQRNIMYGQCPIEQADFKVIDKESQQVVRLEHYNQIPCEPCHKR